MTVTKIAKHPRRIMRQKVRDVRVAVTDRSPSWVRALFAPATHYADMLLVDHGIFRLFYQNRHRLADGVWRSAQPAPHQVRAIAGLGVRPSSISGAHGTAAAIGSSGRRASRRGPSRELPGALARRAEQGRGLRRPRSVRARPISHAHALQVGRGSRRADEHAVPDCEGKSSRRYCTRAARPEVRAHSPGGYRHSRLLLRALSRGQRKAPIEFFDWVERSYDPEDLKRSFAAKGWANMVVNRILRRE